MDRAGGPSGMSLLRNSGYNLAASLVPIALSLLTIPAYIHALGDARYGVTVIFAAMLGYFGVLDLGLSRAVAQRIAAIRDDDGVERSRIFWSAAGVNAALGLVGAALLLPLAQWVFRSQIKAPAELHQEMVAAAPWLALTLPVALLTQVLRGALQGAERFASLNLITTTGAIFSQLVTLAVALFVSANLAVLLPVMFATRLYNLGGMAWDVARNVLPDLRPRFERRRAADLLSFGGWVAVSGIVSPIMTAFDRFVIGAMVGAGAVSHYTVPFQLGERILVVPVAVSDALFPRIAGLDPEEGRRLAVRTMAVLSAIMTPGMVLGILALEPFLALWISPEFALAAAPAGRILLAGFCVNSFAFAFFVLLQAGGRPRLVAMAHVIEVLPFLALLFAALKLAGLPGAAAAFSIRVAIDLFLLSAFAGTLRVTLRLSATPLVLLGLALAVAPQVRADQTGSVAAAVALLGAAAVFGWRRMAGQGLSPAALAQSLLRRQAPA